MPMMPTTVRTRAKMTPNTIVRIVVHAAMMPND
jgi:hypothetical protein